MKRPIIFLSFCLFMVSCTSSPTRTVEPVTDTNTLVSTKIAVPTSSETDPFRCMSPIRTFEYQTGDVPSDFDWSIVENQVLPPQEWQRIKNIPYTSELILIQARDSGETEFWIRTRSSGLVRYSLKDNQPETGTILAGPSEMNVVYFLDHQNNVWSAKYDGDSEPLLNRYNEQTNQWEPVTIDLANQNELGISHVEVDEQGKFWLLVNKGVEHLLYSLDPNTLTTERHLVEYDLSADSFVIAHNTIYIVAEEYLQPTKYDTGLRYLLLQYPLNGDIIKADYIGEPMYVGYTRSSYGYLPKSLFVDSQQRVWIGGRGWFDLQTKEWHYVIPDPVFITVLGGAGKWVWGGPQITAETPDGRLWFNALRGTGWVDTELGKWCVFTNYQSNVLPDSYGNLWLVADEGLYMRKK